MRLAVIDLGTNSVRFDVHQLVAGRRIQTLHREKLMIRLGQGVFTEGRLDPEAIRRTIEAFHGFKIVAKDLHVNETIAFGTSALREASDSEKLLQQIQKKTGIQVQVISGAEEARLIALGVLSKEKSLKGRFALLDIGGGSTEISICRGKEVQFAESFQLGTARLQQIFLKSSPPKAPSKKGDLHPIEELRRYIRGLIGGKMAAESWPKVDRLVGSSGTVKAMARLLRPKGKLRPIERSDLKKIVKKMSDMTTTQLLGLPGMESKRVDMILAGAILLEETMDALGAKRVMMTDFSLRDGILHEQAVRLLKESGPSFGQRLEVFRSKASRMGVAPFHIVAVERLVTQLFEKLKSVHKLNRRWLPYLQAAAILHDIGESVSTSRHDEHSYYVVKNADFPGMEPWEIEFIAELCRHHRGNARVGLKEFKKLPFETKEQIAAFPKLLSLLRLADALDRGHRGQAQISAVKISRKGVVLFLTSEKGPMDLELLRIEQKKDLFEKVFQRELHAKKS
ncbi:MAG: Ppx/GppA family phosphatase [Bdellovibrionales bacterium]|nr:Ppx/GppA family phosphatase [Bdellovibrionales bacterium]